MRFAEPIAELRRIPVYLVNDTGAPITGAVPTGTQFRVSKSGSSLANAAGTWSEVGSGLYTYEATLSEVTTESFLLLRVALAGVRPYVYAVDIGDRIVPGAAPAARRVPVYLVDVNANPVSGLTLSPQVSLAGGALTAGAGTTGQIGDGAYFYELAQTELVEGPGVLRIAHASAQTYVYTWDVRTAGTPLAEEPEAILVSPEISDQIPAIDRVALALSRLPSQYRGSDG